MSDRNQDRVAVPYRGPVKGGSSKGDEGKRGCVLCWPDKAMCSSEACCARTTAARAAAAMATRSSAASAHGPPAREAFIALRMGHATYDLA